MTITPPARIPQDVIRWIRSRGGDHAILLITVDGRLRPHVMMLARDEVYVVSKARVRIALGAKSQSAENLRLRSSATLAIYDADLACVVKTHVTKDARRLQRGTVACELGVESVRLDTPTKEETRARLVTGLRFEGRKEREDIRERLQTLDE